MKNIKPCIGRFLCAAIVAGAMATWAPPSHAQATPEATAREDIEMNARFDALDTVLRKADIPALPDLPKLVPLDTKKPVGSTYYEQAFAMPDGCSFFSVNADGELAAGARWTGAPCNGGLVSGRGSLAVTFAQRGAGGKTTFAHKLYEGDFADGFLHGAGIKQIYSYDSSRQPTGEYYRQEGQFKYGLIEGKGRKFEVDKKSKKLNAIMREGNFVASLPVGHVFLVRSNPFVGALADQYELIYNDKGQILRFPLSTGDRKPLSGRIRFAGKGGEWTVQLEAFDKGLLESGLLKKVVKGKNGGVDMYAGYCKRWSLGEDGAWQCNRGNYLEGHSRDVSFYATDAIYAFNPQIPRDWAFDPRQPITIGVGIGISSESPSMLCNDDRTQCKGKMTIPVSLCTEYRGPAELRAGKLIPAGGPGEFYTTCKKGEKKPFRMEQINKLAARCDSFDSPIRCARGRTFSDDGVEYAGPFVLDNIRVGTSEDAPGEVARYMFVKENMGFSFRREGWGHLTFPDQRWAKVRFVGDEYAEVGACGATDIKVTRCTLDADTLVFHY